MDILLTFAGNRDPFNPEIIQGINSDGPVLTLLGERQGQYSIRINDQWRVCFKWMAGDAHDVEIVDYH
jgi:Txe/YoeB family toxin of Txe-Axe toxin-antitoxin module